VAAAQLAPAGAAQGPNYAPVASSAIARDIDRWNSLRQSDSQHFSVYAGFLLGHRGWPGEAAMRGAAERRLLVDQVAGVDVLRYFSVFPPTKSAGHAHLAFVLQAGRQTEEARASARRAWTAGVLPPEVEQRLLATFPGVFTAQDHDRRLDVLLSNGDRQSAARALAWASPSRRPVFEARLALQNRSADAASRAAAAGPAGISDAGLLIDRATWLRASGNSLGSRQLLAQQRRLSAPPANPEKFMEAVLVIARAAAADRQWQAVYQIASQVDDIFPAGTDVSRRSYGERDEYTNLTWLAGQAAMNGGRHLEAAAMFDRYGRAAQSSQTRAKGFYWAARAATAAGQRDRATAWLEQAAGSPDQFYGLLALERLGRTPPPPPAAPPSTAEERASFARRPLAEAIRYLGSVGRRADQTVFVRALASALDSNRDRAVSAEYGRAIGRLDMGVWAAREARSNGDTFYERPAFPEVSIPAAYRHVWAAAHGIMRQESSFERSAVSSAGARGMMQLMPATASMEARRLGIPYSLSRLTEDPDYNILLGSFHLTGLMDRFGNNLVLVAVAYNAGPGRVPQWIALNGDPRRPGTDVIDWIEKIPFSETRNYVQRVIENAMVYDLMSPSGGRSGGRVSYFLGTRAIR